MDPIPQPQKQNDDLILKNNSEPTTSSGPSTSITTSLSSPVATTTQTPEVSTSVSTSVTTSASPTLSSSTPDTIPISSPVSASSAAIQNSVSEPTSPEFDGLMTELNNYQPTAEDLQSPNQTTSVASTPLEPSGSSLAIDGSKTSPTPSDSTSLTSSFSPASTDPTLAVDPLNGSTSFASPNSDPTNSITPVGNGQPTEVVENEEEDDSEDKPLVAAEPTPGSIGSAVSYADFEKKQAEEAAKQAKSQNKPKIKITRTTILIIIAAVLFIIVGIILALTLFSKPQKKPAEASVKNQTTKASTKILTCVRPLSTNESSAVGAAYGNFERQFTFEDDNLNTISENYVYQFNSENEAIAAKTTLDASIKSDEKTKVTTEINVNQLKKISVTSGGNVDSYLKSLSEFSSITNFDLNSLMSAENQTGLSCSTIE